MANANHPDSSAAGDKGTDISSAGDLAYKEWDSCRGVIATLDDRITDLRKYGFTLVTALFAVTGLISKFIGTSGFILTPGVQFAVFVVTLLLILTLFIIDDMYGTEQRAAEFRARILETRLNLELTETTAYLYKRDHMRTFFKWVYVAFLSGAAILGFCVLVSTSSVSPVATTTVTSSSNTTASEISSNSTTNISSSSSGTSITNLSSPNSSITTVIVSTTTPVAITTVSATTYPSPSVTTSTSSSATSITHFPGSFSIGSFPVDFSLLILAAWFLSVFSLFMIDEHFKPPSNAPDWTVNRVDCIQGTPVRITLTNIGMNILKYKKGDEAWKVELESRKKTNTPNKGTIEEFSDQFNRSGLIKLGQTCDWLWNTEDMVPGIYRILVAIQNKQGSFTKPVISPETDAPRKKSVVKTKSVKKLIPDNLRILEVVTENEDGDKKGYWVLSRKVFIKEKSPADVANPGDLSDSD
jgi:hypothetical protein